MCDHQLLAMPQNDNSCKEDDHISPLRTLAEIRIAIDSRHYTGSRSHGLIKEFQLYIDFRTTIIIAVATV